MNTAKMEFNFVPGEEIERMKIAATPPDIAQRYGKAFALEGK
jgi:hypothetical protein